MREAAESKDKPFGSNTARAYFKFDVDDGIKDIKSVRLKFYAGSTKGTKELFVIVPANEKYFDEKKLTWASHYPQVFNFKETGYIWLNGERMPDSHEKLWGVEYEWLNFVTRLYPAGWCISRYLAEKDEIYAYRALEMLLSLYTARESGVYPRILEGGWRTEYLCEVLFGTLNSIYSTPETLKAQLKYMFAHLRDLKDVQHAAANWESAVRVGFMRLCAYVPEIVPKGWQLHAKKRVAELFTRDTLTPGGAYFESCSGYIVGVVRELKLCLTLIEITEGTEDEYYKILLKQYKRLTRYYFNMTMNCGCTIPWGDGGRADIRKFAEEENRFIPNTDFEYFATNGEKGICPDYTSVIYEDKAIAFMRSDWKKDGFSAMINADYGGNHSHRDDLALDVCAYGRLMLVDVGIGSYSPGSMMADVNRYTISHNTIEIDGKDQKYKTYGKPGEPGVPQYMKLSSNKLFDFISASSEMIYPGFSDKRRVLFLHNRFWIVSDYIVPEDDKPHTYRQAWHPDAKNRLTVNAATKTMFTDYESGANIYVVPADPEKEEAVIAENYIMHPVYREIKTKYLFYRRENVCGAQKFDTVLFPVREGETASVSAERIQADGKSTAMKIRINENTGFYCCSNTETPAQIYFGEYTADAQTAYAETNAAGQITMIALTKATGLKQNGNTIVSCENRARDLGIKFAEDGVHIFSEGGKPEELEIKTVKPKCVTLNGKSIDFEYTVNNTVKLK